MGICKCEDGNCSVHISRHSTIAKVTPKDKYYKKLSPCKCPNCKCDDHSECDCEDCECKNCGCD